MNELPALLLQYPHLQGLNVTIPYKREVLPYLHDVSGLPASLQACNCISIKKGKLSGFNTDWVGFEHSLQPLLQKHHTHALVLGNGGASKAVLYVLQKMGIQYEVVGRRLQPEVTTTYDQLDAAAVARHPLIINTTPLGTFPNVDQCPPIPYEGVTPFHLLYDLVYNPTHTAFLQQGALRGATVKNGYDMLIGQAECAWQIWNNP